MYRENADYMDGNGNEEVVVKSRAERVAEAKRAFTDNGYRDSSSTYHTPYGSASSDTSGEKRHLSALIRLMASGMLFLILGIAFYNNFSYNGFDKDYVLECLDRSNIWDSLVRGVGDMADKAVGWYNSVNP